MSEKTRRKSGTGRQSHAAKDSAKNNKKNEKKPIRREIGAFVCLFLAFFVILCILGVDAAFLRLVRFVFRGLVGSGFYVLPFSFILGFLILILHDGRPVSLRVTCAMLVPLTIGSIVMLVAGQESADWGIEMVAELWKGGVEGSSGGLASGLLAQILEKLISKPGAVILLTAASVLEILTGLDMTVTGIIRAIRNRPRAQYDEPKREHPDRAEVLVNHVAQKHIEKTELRRSRARQIDIPLDDLPQQPAQEEKEPNAAAGRKKTIRPDEYIEQSRRDALEKKRAAQEEAKAQTERHTDYEPQVASLLETEGTAQSHESGMPPLIVPTSAEEPAIVQSAQEDIPQEDIPQQTDLAEPRQELPLVVPTRSRENAPVILTAPEKPAKTAGERRTEAKALSGEDLPPLEQQKKEKLGKEELQQEAEQIAQQIDQQAAPPEYSYPSAELLRVAGPASADGTEEMRQNVTRLSDTLKSFGIEPHITNVIRGPSVTRYELELDRGVKLSKLTNLSDDIALALGASGVRIAAIPEKISVVGIEVPNKLVSMVSARDVIDSEEFRKSKSRLSFAIGKDIGGSRIIGDIAKLPHMLIAGTTGSGKSVCMNSLIISLLYKSKPEEVKLIMVDPKMVELGIYNGIPHLLIPVVTDPKKAAGALQWGVTEMMRRYRMMADAGVRDLESFNRLMKSTGEAEPLPKVVVVIDELADLMLVAAKEVEESICRIAQMGRASGIHLIIATQRPSADVITGLMKANIPSRIAFAVASAMESRIILDTGGAEKLVGKGDMLYAPLGQGKPKRVQGCFISDDEVQSVVEFIKASNSADYSSEVMQQIEQKAAEGGKNAASGGAAAAAESAESEDDEMLAQAVEVILETGQASVSMLQRRLKLGYARAARIMDAMEEKGIVGPYEGSKPRAMLVTKQEWEAMKNGTAANPAVEEEIP